MPMARPRWSRKPHGQGRLSHQRARRLKLATDVAKRLENTMDHDQIEATGSLFPRSCSMRTARNKRMFACLRDMKGRVFTKRLCTMICKRLLSNLPFKLNGAPRESPEDYLDAQAGRLARLAKKSKRMADDLDTQPYVDAPTYFF